MNTDTQQWTIVSSLPHPVHLATATLCGDNVFMLGGFDQEVEPSRSMFQCSLNALLHSDDSHREWQQVADLPVTHSACATLKGRLLAIGGKDSTKKTTTAIHAYSPATNSWNVVCSRIPTPCWRCAVAVLSENRVMVVDYKTVHIGTLQEKTCTVQ